MSIQIEPLPIGPGGNSPSKQQLNKTNELLTMLTAQSHADTMYDAPIPAPITAQTVEKFSQYVTPTNIAIIGILLIAYGIVSK